MSTESRVLDRLARTPAPATERMRGPALAREVDGLAALAGALDRQLGHCRRHRSALALVWIGVATVEPEGSHHLAGESTWVEPDAVEQRGWRAAIERRAIDELRHRICGRVRGDDQVLHVNPRETCVLLAGVADTVVGRIALRLERALNGPYRLGDQRVDVSVRLGSAAHPRDGATAPELLRRAIGW